MASRNIGAALAATVLVWVAALYLSPAAGAAQEGPFAATIAFAQLSASSGDAVLPAVKSVSTTKVSESVTAVDYGNESSVQFTVEVTGASTTGESVEVKVGTGAGAAACTATLSGGIGKCKLAGNAVLSAALEPYAVVAHYAGDSNLEASEGTIAGGLTVTGGRTITSVSASPSSEVTYGEESTVEFTAEVTAENGTPLPSGETAHIHIGSQECTVTLSGGEASRGKCTIAAAALAGGARYPVSAEYAGDDNLSESASTNSLSLTVKRKSTSFKIKLSGGETSISIPYESTAKLEEAGLPAEAHGTVKFVSGATTLCELTLPATSCTTSAALAVGSYPGISATFTETSGNYASSTITGGLALTVTGTPAPFTVQVNGSASPAPIVYGAAATLTETGLPGGAHGTITFSTGSTTLCSFTVPAESSCPQALAAGSYEITASFLVSSGSYVNSTASNSVTLKVERAPTSFTIAIGGSSSAKLTFGSTATLSETGLPAGARGTVTFTSGNTTLCAAALPTASCATSSELAAGSYSPITATFNDSDGNYAGSASTGSAALTLERVTSVIAISSSPSPSTPYARLTLTATVAPGTPISRVPTGTVTFMSGAHTLGTGTLDAHGVATLETVAPGPGAYYASATYGGDSAYQAGQSPTIIQSVKETFAGLFELTATYTHGSSGYRKLASKKRVLADAQLAAIDRLLAIADQKPAKSVLVATIYDADVILAEGQHLLSSAQRESLITLADALPAPKVVAVTALGRTVKGHAVAVGTIRSGNAELTLRKLTGAHVNNFMLVIRTRAHGHMQTLLSRALKLL
jgi:hypothetical protein